MATDNDWIMPSFYEEGLDIPDPFGHRDIEAELAAFREQWQQELTVRQAQGADGHLDSSGKAPPGSGNTQEHPLHPSKEEEARYLFLQGVNAEQRHRLSEAIQYYRRAVQLVPDIEFRITDYGRTEDNANANERTRQESESLDCDVAAEEDEDLSNLALRFSRLSNSTSMCEPEYQQGAAHISDLPAELVQLVLRWVVSGDLDVVSLERVALVSRGFYLATRDERIWRLICLRVWGRNCGKVKSYGTWRNMYLTRPHLNFNGCFISRMSYFRQGEHGLDNFCRPFHLVEYYRYIRFFPDGAMLMLTTPDDPYATVADLKSRHTRVQGVLSGYYNLTGNQVTAVLRRKSQQEKIVYRHKWQRRNQEKNESEQIFYVVAPAIFYSRRTNCPYEGKLPRWNMDHPSTVPREFELESGTSGRRKQQLSWVRYSIKTKYKSTGHESQSDLELSAQNYPNLIFSRVKSYTAEAQEPLSSL